MFGTTAATAPSASWSISRSRSHDIQNDSTSKRVLAVGAKAWASPVQPRRSSRCGQSVGNDTKLSRCDHATLEWSCSRRGSEEAKVERGVSALEMATAVADTTSAPVTSAYWKPWNVKSGSSVLSPSSASTYASVAIAVRRDLVWIDPSGSSTSAWRTSTRSPADPRTTSRSQPAMFWPT